MAAEAGAVNGVAPLLNDQRIQLAQELSSAAHALNRAAITSERLSKMLTSIDFEEQSPTEQQTAYLTVLTATRDLSSLFTLNPPPDEDGKKKRKRVAKDPNAPKKPVTGYLLYQEEQKRELKGKEDTPAYKEMLKLIGAKWKELTDAEKQPYEEAHKAAVAQYEIEKAAYDQSLGLSPVTEIPKEDKKSKEKPKAKEDKPAAKPRASDAKASTSKAATKPASKAAPPPQESEESSEEDSSTEEEDSEEEEVVPEPPKKKAKAEPAKPAAKATNSRKDKAPASRKK